jgi:SNF2 family DNA or RNA helicase
MAKIVKIACSKNSKIEIFYKTLSTTEKDDIVSLLYDYGCNILDQDRNSFKIEPNDFSVSVIDLLKYLKRRTVQVKLDARAEKIVEQIYHFNRKNPKVKFRLSSNFHRKITNLQRRNVNRLLQYKHGASFSVPGAGKTTEALAFLDGQKNKYATLIICPKNAFGSWEEQLKQCLRKYFCKRLVGNDASVLREAKNPRGFFFITYSKFSNISEKLLPVLSTKPFNIILDESHKIKKGEDGKWGREVLRIAPFAESRIILSGTPLPNSEDDLIPQIKFLFPHLKTISDPGVFIKKYYVRTTKKELKLPKLSCRLVNIPLSKNQNHLYKIIKSRMFRNTIGIHNLKDRETLRKINKCYIQLLQVISNPLLLLKAGFQFDDNNIYKLFEEGPKISYACIKARQLAAKGQKVIIWSYFKENIDLIASHLRDLNAVLIYGDTNVGDEKEEDTREFRINKFKNDESCSVLVANPAACGESISLHQNCHFAIYVDRTYNAAHYLQSQDRIHRFGLPKHTKTNVEILFSKNTIDESINRRLNQKTRRMAEILSDSSLHIEPEDDDDLFISNIKDAQDLLNTINKNDR